MARLGIEKAIILAGQIPQVLHKEYYLTEDEIIESIELKFNNGFDYKYKEIRKVLDILETANVITKAISIQPQYRIYS